MNEQTRLAQILDQFFDSAVVEKEYYKITKKKAPAKNSSAFQWTNAHIQEVISDLKSNPADCGRKYDVVQEDGVDTLILKRPYRLNFNIYRKVMSLENSFAIIAPVHRELHHQGYRQIYERLKVYWTFPGTFVKALVTVCNVCQMLSNTFIENDFEYLTARDRDLRSWRVKLICMESECHYILRPKFILVCEDIESEFLILRTLNEKSIAEVSEELTKIFLLHGAPKTMLANNVMKTILDPALKSINKLHPDFVVSTYFDSRMVIRNSDIIDALKKWIEVVEDSMYEIDCVVGCHVVQRSLNTRLRLKKTGNAYKAFIPHNRFMMQKLNWSSWNEEVMISDDTKNVQVKFEKEELNLSDTEIIKEEVVEVDSSDTEVMKVEVEDDPLEKREIEKDVAKNEVKSSKRKIKAEPGPSTMKQKKE